jgi:hypothetical protein
VDRVATEWRNAGRVTAAQQGAIVDVARRAERDLV